MVQGKSSWKGQLRRFRIRFSCLLEDFERAPKWCWSLIEDLIRPINFRIRSLNQTNQFPTMKFVVRVRAFGQRLAAQGSTRDKLNRDLSLPSRSTMLWMVQWLCLHALIGTQSWMVQLKIHVGAKVVAWKVWLHSHNQKGFGYLSNRGHSYTSIYFHDNS